MLTLAEKRMRQRQKREAEQAKAVPSEKIQALESELARLREMIAGVILATGNNARQCAPPPPPPPFPGMPSSGAPGAPPPPPPPLPNLLLPAKVNVIDSIKMVRVHPCPVLLLSRQTKSLNPYPPPPPSAAVSDKQNRKNGGQADAPKKAVPSMADVLKNMGSVKLRSVTR